MKLGPDAYMYAFKYVKSLPIKMADGRFSVASDTVQNL